CFAFPPPGALLALWAQYWTSATDWPLNIGGKPLDSLPAFIPITFEMAVLFGGLGVVLVLFLRCRMWPGRRTEEPCAGVTDDRFVLVVRLAGASPTEEDFRALGARHGALAVRDDFTIEEGDAC
ncbi:MAG: DUF3341 domain-containing protein, partial [Planctomycetota bacterium]